MTPLETSLKAAAAASGGWVRGLVDEMRAYYVDWRRDAASVLQSYREWSAARAPHRASRYLAYKEALDHEEASAFRYALVIMEIERALESTESLAKLVGAARDGDRAAVSGGS
jgi:hypothetical protein